MTEQAEAQGLQLTETFIGECITGTCDRPATVRVYEDFVLCALHHAMHEAGEDIDEAGIGLELVAGWLSVATMHGNGYLQGLLGYAKDELLHRKEWADRRMDQLKQVEHENLGNDKIRLRMGQMARKSEQEEAGALPEFSTFGRQIVAVTGYPGTDRRRLARDMVHTAGGRFEADRENLVPALEARMRSAYHDELPPGFLVALIKGLALPEEEATALAKTYALEEEEPPTVGEHQNAPAAEEPSEEAQAMPAERMEARKRAVAALPPEQRERGRRLLARSDALSHAVTAVCSEGWPIEERKAETLKALTELRDEASAELGRFREEVGIPGF